MNEPRLVEVRRNVLKQNDVIARGLREQFRAAGVSDEVVARLRNWGMAYTDRAVRLQYH